MHFWKSNGSRSSTRSHALVLAAATLGLAGSAQGDLIAQDHFLTGTNAANGEYSLTPLNQIVRSTANGGGQNPTIAGYTGAWVGNVNGVAQWTIAATSIESPYVTGLNYAEGGRPRWTGSSIVAHQRRVHRQLSSYTPSNTYYMSFLSQAALNDTGNDGFVGIGFTNLPGTGTTPDPQFATGGTGVRGLMVGVAGDGTGYDYVVRHVGASGMKNDVILDNIVQNDSEGAVIVRYTVVRLDFNDDPTNPAGNSKITIWQDPDLTALSSEAAATAAAAPLTFRTFALGTNADLTHMSFVGIAYDKAVSFDEPRLATDWNSVVPEPASLGVLALAGLATLRRRR